MKIPFDEKETIDFIYQQEYQELDWLSRKLNVKSFSIETTEELANQYKKPMEILGENSTFKPTKIIHIVIVLSVIFLLIMSLYHSTTPWEDISLLTVAGQVGVFGLCIILLIVFGNKEGLQVILCKDGITVNQFYYKWEEVYKIYIVQRETGDNRIKYIILALDTGVTDRFDISELSIYGAPVKKLSAHIEYFKRR